MQRFGPGLILLTPFSSLSPASDPSCGAISLKQTHLNFNSHFLLSYILLIRSETSWLCVIWESQDHLTHDWEEHQLSRSKQKELVYKYKETGCTNQSFTAMRGQKPSWSVSACPLVLWGSSSFTAFHSTGPPERKLHKDLNCRLHRLFFTDVTHELRNVSDIQ